MFDPSLNEIYQAKLSTEDFNRLSSFIYKESGIKLPPVKRIMLQSRLQRRLKDLKIATFKEYCEYVFSKDGLNNEIIHMLDVVSTNKTDFFREPAHFEFLSSLVLPEFIEGSNNKIFKVWSAGSSSGEEPYTIAITLFEFTEQHPGFSFSILGTDISTRILEKATNAVYRGDSVENMPYNLTKKYLLKTTDRTNPTIKIAPHVRQEVRFDRLNLMDDYYNLPDTFDVIFCRNVLIYFDRQTQEKVINKLCAKLKPNGYFFLGHSESIMNMEVSLKHIKPTIYIKK